MYPLNLRKLRILLALLFLNISSELFIFLYEGRESSLRAY